MTSAAPIGVFDSGIGGLSVLRALQAELPHERFVYLADTGFAPYGERGDAFVRQRSGAITEWLIRAHAIKALVVACNTATAAAIHVLRARHPDVPIVGVEPALKPAAAATRTGRVGVLATRGTVASAKFRSLLTSLSGRVDFTVQPCQGLARAIEYSAQPGAAGTEHTAEVAALCARYLEAAGPFGTQVGAADTLVLGCTHYVFALPALRRLVGPGVRILETGAPVARQTQRLLTHAGRLVPAGAGGAVKPFTTGDPAWLDIAAARWLSGPAEAARRVEITMADAALPASIPGVRPSSSAPASAHSAPMA